MSATHDVALTRPSRGAKKANEEAEEKGAGNHCRPPSCTRRSHSEEPCRREHAQTTSAKSRKLSNEPGSAAGRDRARPAKGANRRPTSAIGDPTQVVLDDDDMHMELQRSAEPRQKKPRPVRRRGAECAAARAPTGHGEAAGQVECLGDERCN